MTLDRPGHIDRVNEHRFVSSGGTFQSYRRPDTLFRDADEDDWDRLARKQRYARQAKAAEAAPPPPPKPPPPTSSDARIPLDQLVHGERYDGHVIAWMPDRGVGFAVQGPYRRHDGIFFHVADVRVDPARLAVGQRVKFSFKCVEDGPNRGKQRVNWMEIVDDGPTRVR